jgi:hypothetical protein
MLMDARILIIAGFLVPSLAGALSANPADPSAPVAPQRYQPVTGGTKSYRPVEPMQWGDVNRRVTPPGARSPQSPGANTNPATKGGDAPAKKDTPQPKQ